MPLKQESSAPDPLEAREFGKSLRRHVEEFGALFGAIFLAVAGWAIYRHKSSELALLLIALGVVFPALGYCLPRALLPLRNAWMKLAHMLGMVVTFAILGLTWAGVVLPMAGLLKVFGKQVMDLRFGAPVDSYWETRKPGSDDFQLLRRQF